MIRRMSSVVGLALGYTQNQRRRKRREERYKAQLLRAEMDGVEPPEPPIDSEHIPHHHKPLFQRIKKRDLFLYFWSAIGLLAGFLGVSYGIYKAILQTIPVPKNPCQIHGELHNISISKDGMGPKWREVWVPLVDHPDLSEECMPLEPVQVYFYAINGTAWNITMSGSNATEMQTWGY
jgi:hypothetical protein